MFGGSFAYSFIIIYNLKIMKESLAGLNNKGKESQKGATEQSGFTIESIRKKMSRGKVFLLTALMATSFRGDFSSEKKEPSKAKVEMNKASIDPESDVSNALVKILTPEEFEKFSKSKKEVPEIFYTKNALEKIIKLDQIFDINPKNFYTLEWNGEQLMNFLDEIENYKILEELRNEFPKDVKPDIGILPKIDINYLKDKECLQSLKNLAKIGMTGSNTLEKEYLKKLTTKSALFKSLEKMSQMGALLDMSIINYSTLQLYEEDFDKKLTIFTQSNKNIQALKYSFDSKIGILELDYLMADDTGYWADFFENEGNKVAIENLSKMGYDFSSILQMGKDLTSKIKEEDYMEMLEEFSKVLPYTEISNGQFRMIMGFLRSYYDLSDKNNIQKITETFRDLEKSDSYSKDVSKFADKILEKITSNAKENIFAPVLSQAQGRDAKYENIINDPAVKILIKLGYHEQFPEFLKSLPEGERAEWMLRISRDMYFAGKKASPENFEETYCEIIALRNNKEIIEQSLFKNRNVALFAHNEKWDDGSTRFGTEYTQQNLKNQKPSELKIFRAKNTLESLGYTKKEFLKYIENTKNVTIMFEAHGSPKAVAFTEGVPKEDGTIVMPYGNGSLDYDELSNALAQRHKNGFHDRPIIIMGSCFNQDFIRNLCAEIQNINNSQKKHIPIPICIGDTEFGQYSFSDDIKNGSLFLKAILENKINTKIKDVIELEAGENLKEDYNKSRVISIFVPVNENIKFSKKRKSKIETFYQIADVFKANPNYMNFTNSKENMIKPPISKQDHKDLNKDA